MAIETYPGNLRIGVMDAVPKQAVSTKSLRVQAKFKLLVLLSGFHSFMVNSKTVVLDARQHPTAVTLSLPDGGQICHLERGGNPYRKLAIAADWDWFQDFSVLTNTDHPMRTASGGVEVRSWTPSTDIVRLATQIVLPPPGTDPAQVELVRMSTALDILRRVLQRPDDGGGQEKLSLAETIRQRLLKQPDDPTLLPRLEADTGLCRRSLQRHFKQAFGETISAYQRRVMLQSAHRALCEDGVSIASAAEIAGYSSPANFSTAFRRAYGVTPKVLQKV
ncbi:AraC family transcriptional regulator [Thalassovita sp.]|uniref:helix-turn-helix domain-containing protein n=1 Tax=Thalassovita sp. TaxID=1979401 RepID=UPI002AB257BC|nr:AraC family transcriptional regulator [Thalassovita sp.]